MLTKAYISDIINSSLIKVRIPLFNKIDGVNGATPKSELSTACVCSLPNFITAPQTGDIVIVGFEEDDTSKPVVLGYLSKNTESNSMTDIKCNKLVAIDDVELNEHTTIGDILPENIKCLKNLKHNINTTFQETNKSIDNINKKIETINTNISDNTTSIEANEESIKTLNTNVSNLIGKVEKLEKDYKNMLNKFDEYLKKYPTIFDVRSYGPSISEVSNPQEGQIYFTIKGEN